MLFFGPGSVSALSAAEAGEVTPAEKSVEEEWQELKTLGQPGRRAIQNDGKLAHAEARQQFVRELLQDADRFQQFHTRHPSHTGAKEAKRMEALALVLAWQAGDSTRELRRIQLVRDLRTDLAIPASKRAEVAAFADNIGVEKRAGLAPEARLAAFEEVARKLVAEFPELPKAYESLLRVASDSPPEQAQAIARDILSLPAPAQIHDGAQALLDRYALVGQPLAEVLRPWWRDDGLFASAQNNPAILYSWSSSSVGSIALAKDLAAKMPAGAVIFGVCLDTRELAPARARAAMEKLPGVQIFDWMGPGGEIAEQLEMQEPGLVYFVNAAGGIRSVSAQRNLAAELAALSNR